MNEGNDILNEILAFYSPEEKSVIENAYTFAKEALMGKVRENKHPFIEHPLGVAKIIAQDVGLGYESIVAIFLHESIRFNPELMTKIPKGTFSDEVINIALSLNKIAAINPRDTNLEADNYKRLIVSYSKDPRVTIIKLADRLDVMRNIDLLPAASKEKKATETILLYIPIAHQLGLYRVKSELEDLFFKFTEPEKYRMITNMLSASEAERISFTRSFMEPLVRKIEKEGIHFTIKSRTKTAYSIWKKMMKQNIPFEEVHDVFAIRIIIDTEPNREKEHALCWKVYSLVTEEYTPDTSRLRDWIDKPKANGYESLHTTVSDKEGNSVEVQIRTTRMDNIAENGLASHWSYKGIKNDNSLSLWLSSVRTALENNSESSYEDAALYRRNEVFVFTPEGELKRLPANACVLDFAFSIHSNLGLKCSGALIGGKPVSIREKLITGSTVSILSNKNQKPSPDWLNFVVSSKARNKIKQKLKEEEVKQSQTGKELLERRLKNWKMEISDEDLMNLCKKYKLKSINELFAQIGNSLIDTSEIKDYLSSKSHIAVTEKKADPSVTRIKTKNSPTNVLIINDKLGGLGYKMAKCCNPIFGDEVFGFVSVKEGVKIHRMSCPNAARLIQNYPYRIVKVRWREDTSLENFQTSIKVIVDAPSVYTAVLGTINNFYATLRSSSIVQMEGKNQGDYCVLIQMLVANNQQLDKIVSAIKKTKGVSNVVRTTNG